jgi:bifunctional DNase/RNase
MRRKFTGIPSDVKKAAAPASSASRPRTNRQMTTQRTRGTLALGAGRSQNEETMGDIERVTIYGVSFDVASKQPIVLLKVEGKNRFLPIWIGHPEAAAILMKLQKAELPRPMTHDLLASVIEQLSATVSAVVITELRENTFYAVIQLEVEGQEIQVDSRPSDAIALAVRTDSPIYVSVELMNANGIEFEQEVEDVEEIVKEFRQFLDEVSPQDF